MDIAATQITLAVVALLAVDAASAQSRPSRLSGYVTVATDYRNRGLSQTDGAPALQAGVDYEHSSGWFTGAFASNVEYAAPYDERDVEVDIYAGYDWELDDWALTATLTRYVYDGAQNEYSELAAGVRFRDRVYFTTSRTSGYVPGGLEMSNHELTLMWPLDRGLEFAATAGRARIEGVASSAYSHWNVGLSKLFSRVSLDVRFYDNDYEITTYIGGAHPDQWVLSVTYGFLGD